MSDGGDLLLFALSAWGETQWPQFKSSFDSLQLARAGGEAHPEVTGYKYARWQAARLLASLGHCDLNYQGKTARIVIAPPVLAPLPAAGLPRAVLCGARSPSTIAELGKESTARGGAVEVSSQVTRVAYAPSRIEVGADSSGVLADIAAGLGIPYPRIPPAWTIACGAGSVAQYLPSLEWSSEPELNWERQAFHPRLLRFDPSPAQELPRRLVRYRDPVRLRWEYRLWHDGQSAQADPAWGRYAVLEAAGRQVVRYEERDGSVRVPRQVPLPVPLARALVLCSGRAPLLERDTGCESYERVPPDVFREIAAKLGQAGGANL